MRMNAKSVSVRNFFERPVVKVSFVHLSRSTPTCSSMSARKRSWRAGKNLKQALADGYGNAFSAIFDSNLTSIITAVILY